VGIYLDPVVDRQEPFRDGLDARTTKPFLAKLLSREGTLIDFITINEGEFHHSEFGQHFGQLRTDRSDANDDDWIVIDSFRIEKDRAAELGIFNHRQDEMRRSRLTRRRRL
jgi:hypothetical protein